ncbi:sulfate adenylyltransferase subunit CysN [Phenylobacterium montanum]|uniref:Multifunctional fusion protein n=1 Tax=Phenylobacterium montanum TaxID=2823693 RepID=A0A975G195_9CAUL|nr:sulfate adenylyltransferase subunit CysN [Caulobacter sp. S6]QUD89050.1 sulfate adenylyltransferase subunit CysN [Caulobacter sp. S6]
MDGAQSPLTELSVEIPVETAERGLLRFLTCGSVDDGKSTLIGRLLYDSKLILDDQLAALERDSRRHGTAGEDIDLALLVDGLEAERQQGITIDVAYRFFTTDRRSFIVADTPGHEQYTRNMATGASGADLAVILVDARKGLLTQTRRHSYICSLLGVRHVVLAVNKIDLVDYDQAVFDRIVADYAAFAEGLGFCSITPIPMSARHGDNVTRASSNTPWHRGPTLVEHLETIDVVSDAAAKPFRFPVQWVNRPDLDFRGFSGTVASGVVRPGDRVTVAASGRESTVRRIVTYDGDLAEARAGDAVTLTLADEVDIARGDLLAPATARPEVADQFAAHVLWMGDEPLLPGRPYLMRIGARHVPVKVTALKHRIDVDTQEHLAGRSLALNEIGVCNLSTSAPIAFDAYADNRETGAFILIDRYTNATVGAGMIDFALRRAGNIHRQALLVSREDRQRLNGHGAAALWFTGLSGSGKSTIANLVERALHERGVRTFLLDGDNVRHGLNRDLGFSDAERVENVRRVGEVAKLFVEAGTIVLCSFISPFRAERRMVRELFEAGEFLEIFVDTPLEACIARDPKGLYAKALDGQIANFTGVSSPYEAPEAAEIVVATEDLSAQEAADRIVEALERAGRI